jgi:hypothetical protein
MVCNGKSMMATKVGSLKCRVIQPDGSILDITLLEGKFAPKLWVNFSVLEFPPSVLRHNGMHKYSIPFYNVYVL